MSNENLNINVNVNDNGATNTLGGLEKKIDDVKNSTDKLDNSSKSLKAQLREVINEMGKYDEGSEAFKKAAVKAANLRERISDMNDTIKAFNPEQKFKAFEGVIGGVANGFSAAEGAMALFGDENKNLEETIRKTQGAMALAQGVNGLLGLGDAFKNLATIIQTNVLMAFNKLKIILLENPITAIAVAVAALIALWVAYNQKVGDVVDTNKKLVSTSDDVLKTIEDETKKLKEQNIELVINLAAKKSGITTDEQRLKNINNEIAANQKLIDDYRKNYGLEKGFIDSNTQSVQVKIDSLKKEGEILEKNINYE